MTTEEFIRAHLHDDVRQLALSHNHDEGVDLRHALEQIAGWQSARRKLPTWAATEGVVYGTHLSMEQCSSEQTALYKARVARQLLSKHDGTTTLVDMTGGLGVDFSFMARAFDRAVYIERDNRLCDIAASNFALLGLQNAEVVCADSSTHIATMDDATLIYADPARRDAHGARTYAISDCTPDILALLPTMLDIAPTAMLKLSPMLDTTRAIDEIETTQAGSVSQVHIVATGGECKELLLIVERHTDATRTIHCSSDDRTFSYADDGDDGSTAARDATARMGIDTGADADTICQALNGRWLHVPDAAVMKAGCFGRLAKRFGVAPIGPNSHLFVANEAVADFPGRTFRIDKATTMNKRQLREALSDIRRANVAVRNFPIAADNLRRRLKLKDGGTTYIFGTTAGNHHVLLVCSKTSGTPI